MEQREKSSQEEFVKEDVIVKNLEQEVRLHWTGRHFCNIARISFRRTCTYLIVFMLDWMPSWGRVKNIGKRTKTG